MDRGSRYEAAKPSSFAAFRPAPPSNGLVVRVLRLSTTPGFRPDNLTEVQEWSRKGYLRSDNGPEFCSKAVPEWLKDLGVETLFIEPGSPWENGYTESFNGKFQDGLLDREIFYPLVDCFRTGYEFEECPSRRRSTIVGLFMRRL